jgi:hypothetical protein
MNRRTLWIRLRQEVATPAVVRQLFPTRAAAVTGTSRSNVPERRFRMATPGSFGDAEDIRVARS